MIQLGEFHADPSHRSAPVVSHATLSMRKINGTLPFETTASRNSSSNYATLQSIYTLYYINPQVWGEYDGFFLAGLLKLIGQQRYSWSLILTKKYSAIELHWSCTGNISTWQDIYPHHKEKKNTIQQGFFISELYCFRVDFSFKVVGN